MRSWHAARQPGHKPCKCARAQAAHLAQRAGGAAGAEGGTLAERSALGGLVPEALLHMLASYGAGAFAAALVGDSDTPELIWTHRMRAQRLVPEARTATVDVCYGGVFFLCSISSLPAWLRRRWSITPNFL